MRTTTLKNGSTIVETTVKVTLTRWDFVAVACWAIARHREIRTRRGLLRAVKRVIHNGGIAQICAAHCDYQQHSGAANELVDRLFPELKNHLARPCCPN